MSFKPNPRFVVEMKRDPAYRAALMAGAQVARARAEALARAAHAPWMRRKGASTIEVHPEGDHVVLVNTDYAGHLQEWGGKNNPAHAPLRRGIRAAGFRFRESPK